MSKPFVNRIRTYEVSSSEIVKYGLAKVMNALFGRLPVDSMLERMSYHVNGVTYDKVFQFNIQSMAFENVMDGAAYPCVTVILTPSEIKKEKEEEPVSSYTKSLPPRRKNYTPPLACTECICDFQYTGLKSHKYDCPRKS